MIEGMIPPQSIESEMAVLGSILKNPSCIVMVGEIIVPDNFHRTSHRSIYKTMLDLYENGQQIDCITVAEKLKEIGILEECGGGYYLIKLQEDTVSSANVIQYAKTVKERYILCDIIKKITDIEKGCYALNSSEEILEQLSQYAISKFEFRKDEIEWRNLLLNTIEHIEEKKFISGIPTSLDKMDSILGGWNQGLVIIAARPSHGKTAFAIQAATHAAKSGYPVGVISLEMKPESLAIRILAAEIKEDSRKLKGGLEDSGYIKLSNHLGSIEKMPIYFSTMSSCRVEDCKAISRAWKRKYDLKMLIIDYLQLMEHIGENATQALGNTTRQIKNLATELEIPILLLSQLSRDNEKEKRWPVLSDLRQSGRIEEDADIVLMIHNPEYDSTEEKEIANILIRKNREGPTGFIETMFIKKYTAFENMM